MVSERLMTVMVTAPEGWNDPQDELTDAEAWAAIKDDIESHLRGFKSGALPMKLEFIEWQELEPASDELDATGHAVETRRDGGVCDNPANARLETAQLGRYSFATKATETDMRLAQDILSGLTSQEIAYRIKGPLA